MALVRMTALKNFLDTALSTTDVSTGYNLGALSTQEQVYGALHLTQNPGTTARVLSMVIQSATASGFGSPAARITFTLSTVAGAQWGTPVGGLSTEHKWWRASWTLSTAASTAGTWKGLVEMGIKRSIR
jgi:hypothetical protein